jgi:hypothetical protein
MLVAVGDNAAIYTSTNGTNWQRQATSFTDWLRSVAYGGGVFVAVGENGRIAYSSNGTTWRPLTSGTTAHLNRVAYIGDRFWVVGNSGATLVSTSGGSWASVNSGATGDLFAVTGNQETRLLAGDSELRLGQIIAWPLFIWSNELDTGKVFLAPKWTYYSSLWDSSAFIIGGRTGMLVEGFRTNTVSGSYSWITSGDYIGNWLWDIIYAPGLFVTVGDRATIMTSEDGANWAREWVPTSVTNAIFLGVSGNGDGLVAVGSQGSIVYSPNQLTDVLVTNMVNSNVVVITNWVSTLGVIWQAIAPRPNPNDLQGICFLDNQWVATGGNGTVLTSPNGTNWTLRSTPTIAFLSSVASFPGGLVAVGDLGVILTSPDGVTWTARSSRTTNWLYRVRYLGGQLIAVGQNGAILTSVNGAEWTPRASGVTYWLNDIAWLNGTYYIVGTQGTMLTSTNAIQWSNGESITQKSLYGLAANRHQLVTVGIEGIILRAQNAPIQIREYSRESGTNWFVFSSRPGRRFALDRSTDLIYWADGSQLELLDNTGLLIYQESSSNAPPHEFYRPTPKP